LDWRAIDTGLFDRAASRGIGIIARTPLAFGFLAGGLDKDTVFPGDDHRSRWSRERVATWVEAADRLVADLNISNDPQSRVAVALRFCLSFEAVATVIPGMLSPAQVLASVAVCDQGPLDAIALRRIEAVYRQYEARLKV
jgi:aryl-alcohol dehydrogenase-like predicted oxidoreductase